MEYFILMILLGIVLIFIKSISADSTLFQSILFVVWVYLIWNLYPKLLSRSDKWRSGPVFLFINRVMVVMAASYIFFLVMNKK